MLRYRPSGSGVRDRAMFHVCFAGALRATELVGLRISYLNMQQYANVVVIGKERRQPSLPLWREIDSALKVRIVVRGTVSMPELFINARGEPMTRWGYRKHTAVASKAYPSISKKYASPHMLRHTSASTAPAGDKRLVESLSMARTCEHADDRNVHSCRTFRKIGSARVCRGTEAVRWSLEGDRQANSVASHVAYYAKTKRRWTLTAAGFAPTDSA
jgi:integrase